MRVAAVELGNANIAQLENLENIDLRKSQATALIATNDPEIHENMSELLAPFSVETVWSKGLEEVKYVLARQKVSVCFCGFWLLDGTYRDVVQAPEIAARRDSGRNCVRPFLSARLSRLSCSAKHQRVRLHLPPLPKVRHREDFEFRGKRSAKTAFADTSNFRTGAAGLRKAS